MVDIAIFLADLGGGGAERVMINLARGFLGNGMTVDLVLVKAEGPYLSQLSSDLKIITLNSSRLISSLLPLVNYLKETNPSILMSALEDTNLIALLAKRIARVSTRVIVTVHNNLSREAQNATQLKRRLTPFFVKLFYPWADKVVGVSSGVAADLLAMGLPSTKIHYIYNPIVTPELKVKLEEPLTHQWFLPNQPPVILGVGRLTQQKDFPTLIRAFSQVRKQRSTRLVLLGDGEERVSLKKLVDDLGLGNDVMFLNFVSNPYIYMAKASVLVLSSAWEGFGNVLVEAMASGTPVVATNCKSGPAEILDNGKYGRLVDVGNVSEMATAIVETLSNSPDKNILRERAYEFTLEKSLLGYEALINSL
jgi:glycosyltransferase involved in cell wall biosynthesis